MVEVRFDIAIRSDVLFESVEPNNIEGTSAVGDRICR